MEKFKCCLCGKEVEGYGNDPHPIQTQNEDDECNLAIVVPARIEIYLKSKTESNVN